MKLARTATAGGLLAALMLLAGCASLRGFDAATAEREARADDAECVREGVSFPSESYDHCRRHLMDERADDRRRENALALQEQSPHAVLNPPLEPEGVHRTINPERFHCYARGEGALQIILCEERRP